MKRQILLTLIAFISLGTFAQVGIGTNTPDGSAILDIQSNNKGVLVPRMTATERLAIATPANALLVYDTDSLSFFYYKLPTTEWINIRHTGVNETDPEVGANTINQVPKWNGSELVAGTITDNGGNIGIGTTTPTHKLSVKVNGQGISHEAADTAIQLGTYVDGTYGAFFQTHTNHPLHLAANNSIAQVTLMPGGNIGAGTTSPDNSAALELSSTNRGFLLPRMTYPQRNTIGSLAEGLMIFNLETERINYFDGVAWKNIDGTSDDWGIGTSYQGGIVAYIFQPGDPGYIAGQTHGLIAQWVDVGIEDWGCSGTPVEGADGTAIGTGNQNTIDIMAVCTTPNIAASHCATVFTYANGYTDWYLPSREELQKIYPNRVAIGQFVGSNYWTSSEITNHHAYIISFIDGLPYSRPKTEAWRVRAIRNF